MTNINSTDELDDILEQATLLMIALDKCTYLCYSGAGQSIVSGILELITFNQERLNEIANTLSAKDMSRIYTHFSKMIRDLGVVKPLYESSSDYLKRIQFNDFIESRINHKTGRYYKYLSSDHKLNVRKDETGKVSSMHYSLLDRGLEVKNGPQLIYDNGELSTIGYYIMGKSNGAWIKCNGNVGPTIFDFNNAEWYQGNHDEFKELVDSYREKISIRYKEKMPIEQTELLQKEIGWGAVLTGSLLTVAMTSIFSNKTKLAVKVKENKHFIKEEV